MKALRGLSKANTIRLVEIEHYVETGNRPDDLPVTDEWIDESIRFLAGEMRPTIDAWGEIADENGDLILISLQAKKLYRSWKKGVKGEEMDQIFKELGELFRRKKRS